MEGRGGEGREGRGGEGREGRGGEEKGGKEKREEEEEGGGGERRRGRFNGQFSLFSLNTKPVQSLLQSSIV